MTFRQGWAARQLLAEERFQSVRAKLRQEDDAFATTVARLRAERATGT